MNGWRGEAFVGSPSESMSHFSSMESRNGHLPTYSSHDGTASCPPPRPSSSSSSMAAQDPPQPRISPSHVDPKFAAPSLSASHLLPIRPVPLSHLQSGQSPTLARVKSSTPGSVSSLGSTGTPPPSSTVVGGQSPFFRPIELSGSPNATSTPVARCAGSTRLPPGNGPLDAETELDWQLENGSRDSAFEDDLSCSRTTPINPTSIRNRKWRQRSCPGGARVKRETHPLDHSIEPISIETTGRRDSGFHSAGPLSAPGSFYPNSFLQDSGSAVSPRSHNPGLVSPCSTSSSLPSPRAPNLLPAVLGGGGTGVPLLPPFTPTPPSPVVSPEPTGANSSYLHNPLLASPLLHPMHPLNYRWPPESLASPFYLCTGMPYPPSLLWNPSLFRLYPPAAHSHPFETNNLSTSPMNPMNHHTHFFAANGHGLNPHVLNSNRPLDMSSTPDVQEVGPYNLSRNALNKVKLGDDVDMKPINESFNSKSAKSGMSHSEMPQSKELLPGDVKIEIMDTTNLKDERDHHNITVTDDSIDTDSILKADGGDQNGLYLLSRGIDRLNECGERRITSLVSPGSDPGNLTGAPVFKRRLSRLDLLCDAASTLEVPTEEPVERQILSAPSSPKPSNKESNGTESRSKSLDGAKSGLNRRYTSPEAERDVKAYLASKSKCPKRIFDQGPKVNVVTPMSGGQPKSESISEKELSMRNSMASIQRQYQEKYKQLFKLQHQCLKQKRSDTHPPHSAPTSESPKSKKPKPATTTTAAHSPSIVDSKGKMKTSDIHPSGSAQSGAPFVNNTTPSVQGPVIDRGRVNDSRSHNENDPRDSKSRPVSMSNKVNALMKPRLDESPQLKSVLDSHHSKVTKNSSKHGFKRSPETLYRWEVRSEPPTSSEMDTSNPQKSHGHLLKFRPHGPSPFKNLLRLTNQDSSLDPASEPTVPDKSDSLGSLDRERKVPEKKKIKIEVEPSMNDSPAPSSPRALLKSEIPDHNEPDEPKGIPNGSLPKSEPVCAVSSNPIVKSEEECGVIKDLLTLKVKRPKSKKSKKDRKNLDSDDADDQSHSHHRRHRHHHHHQKSKRAKKAERRKSKEMSNDQEPEFVEAGTSGCHRRTCVLEESDLMTDTRILFRMDGYFYPGKIQEISPPDIYGVLVDHERGNKPHILTREEILNEVILEMRPPSIDSIPIGTRVCAFWSHKYHYLFPGKVGDPELVDARLGSDYVNIELDDGDSRDISLSDIRLLPVGYPTVQYEPDDIGRRRRKQSTDCSSTEASPLKSRLLVRTTNPVTVIPKASLKVTLSVKGKTKENHGSHQNTSSGSSSHEVAKVKSNVNPDKRDTGISAFLPSQQLWNWFGPPAKTPKKGRGRIIHTGIARKKERLFTGDCAVFLSTGRPDRPFIGRLDSMWETSTGNKRVRVKWFYHAAETEGLANQGKRVQDLTLPGALFESMHYDENDLQTISHGCEVLEISKFRERTLQDRSKLDKLYENNDLYYLAGQYDPVEGTIEFANGVFDEG